MERFGRTLPPRDGPKVIDVTRTGNREREPEEADHYDLLLTALHERRHNGLMAIVGLQLWPCGSLLDEGEVLYRPRGEP